MVEINGWRFTRRACGRLVRVLYLPRPCQTIGDWYGYPPWLPRVRPVWSEIMAQPPACRWCWDVQFTAALSGPNGSKGWNQLVTQVSGGYLRGSEVKRPLEEVPREDRPKLRSWVCKPELRAGVVRLLLEGKSRAEIAAELQVTVRSVDHHVTQALREQGLARTRELREKLGRRVVFAGASVARRAGEGAA